MRPSRIVLLLVAIIAGGLAAFLATRGDAPVEVAAPEVIEEAKTQILVAIEPIGVGQRLSDETVQWLDWPEGAVRPGYITMTASPDGLTEVSGAVARFEIFPGEPILESKLVRSEQGYLSAVLDKGKRGVSISVAAASASGGFIVPNDHVDVVLTRAGISGLISETILHNVKVLAINTRLGEVGTTGEPAEPDNPRAEIFAEGAIATLELDPDQGEKVINASRIGSLSLALRSIADFEGDTTELLQTGNNQTVRIIKFGAESSVLAGNTIAANLPAELDPAAYGVTITPPTMVPGGDVPGMTPGQVPAPTGQ